MSSNSANSHMQIGQVAKLTGLSLRTLRHYDEVGIARPSARSEGGFRLYTADDVKRLHHIRRIIPLGFTLDETAELIELFNSGKPAVRAEEFLKQAQTGRDTLSRKLAQADEVIAMLRQLIDQPHE